MSTEEAAAEYAKSEKALRYQLIEGKIMKDNDIKLDYAELVTMQKDLSARKWHNLAI